MKFTPLLLLTLIAGPALAQNAELQRCRAIPDKDQRVLCYDALAARDAEGRPTAISAAAPSRTDTFGLPAQRPGEADVVGSQIMGLVEGWGPNSLIRLANGQVWQVKDNSSVVLYLKDPKVKVRRGVLGSFILELEGSNETARVQRLP